ncbi:PREDICTED: uncharacterized protein LOC105562278 [Vollenhovia emeryi]|uniref:uncharacterized protein LOC105562278 n=1 Tax=Vollenhovia emeryi TaxID=411798 RepID=UPI0005F4A97C|nr:PREDICTED: uncharacterized protein LOC105562278 [Vollenhovia emeryi]
MAAFERSSSLLLLLAAALLAALTSSVDAAAAAGASSAPSPPSPTLRPADAAGGKKAPRYSSVAEGGLILMSTSQRGGVEATTDSNEPSRARESAPKERYASRVGSVVARKGVEEKIKARKGVQQDTVISTSSTDQNAEKENAPSNRTIFESTKSTMEGSPAIETAHIKSETSDTGNPRLNPTADSLNRSSSSDSSLPLASGTTSRPAIASNAAASQASSHVVKHVPKPKPTVTTVDGPEINESVPLSRTKNPPLGMPRKIDYIVPVIITIVALPILGAAIFVLYRRGRDCWDKRHYRRMDFLIDGMYND